METSRRGFKMMEEREIFMPHPLNVPLMGWVCYTTTLSSPCSLPWIKKRETRE
jgi:hypothetical protein